MRVVIDPNNSHKHYYSPPRICQSTNSIIKMRVVIDPNNSHKHYYYTPRICQSTPLIIAPDHDNDEDDTS